MEIEFDVSSYISQVQGSGGHTITIALILVAGFFGRLVFVAFGPSIAAANPFRNFSGFGLIGLSVAMFVGYLFVTGKQERALHIVQRNTIDPFLVWVLERDSCDLSGSKYCVIIFEDGREISVNWFAKEVYMWELVNPDHGAVWNTLRPISRGDRHPVLEPQFEDLVSS